MWGYKHVSKFVKRWLLVVVVVVVFKYDAKKCEWVWELIGCNGWKHAAFEQMLYNDVLGN